VAKHHDELLSDVRECREVKLAEIDSEEAERKRHLDELAERRLLLIDDSAELRASSG
jgi:hypothetical protein